MRKVTYNFMEAKKRIIPPITTKALHKLNCFFSRYRQTKILTIFLSYFLSEYVNFLLISDVFAPLRSTWATSWWFVWYYIRFLCLFFCCYWFVWVFIWMCLVRIIFHEHLDLLDLVVLQKHDNHENLFTFHDNIRWMCNKNEQKKKLQCRYDVDDVSWIKSNNCIIVDKEQKKTIFNERTIKMKNATNNKKYI